MTQQERFERMQGKWRAAHQAAWEYRLTLKLAYGESYHAPRGKRERLERLTAREDQASDAIFAWLDANSPRDFRRGVPADWVCGSLSYADAVTHGPMSVVPPVAFGCYPSDSQRFAAALSA